MSIKYKRQHINAKTKNKEILELSDKYFKEVVIKVFQRSITKTVEKKERKNKMTQQRKTKWKFWYWKYNWNKQWKGPGAK